MNVNYNHLPTKLQTQYNNSTWFFKHSFLPLQAVLFAWMVANFFNPYFEKYLFGRLESKQTIFSW